MQLETFCLTQTCYDVHELLFKEKMKAYCRWTAEWTPPGLDSSGMYCASPIGGVVFD